MAWYRKAQSTISTEQQKVTTTLIFKKPQKLDFYADSVVLFARMKICFIKKVDGFYHKKI